MGEILTLQVLDPELSFGAESIGRKKKKLVGQDKNIIIFSEDFWALGLKAYDMCACDSTTIFLPCTLEDHVRNLQECRSILDTFVEYMQGCAKEGLIRSPEGFYSEEEASEWLKHSFHNKLNIVDNFFEVFSDLSDSGSVELGANLYFYSVMKLLDEYIVLDLPWSDESQDIFNSIKDIIHILEKRAAIKKAVRKKAKSAVKARHEKTYQEKEKLREWHKNNRHEFLKPDGTLHQSDAAEHICYVLRLTTLKQKKVAEYMGEFEKDFTRK